MPLYLYNHVLPSDERFYIICQYIRLHVSRQICTVAKCECATIKPFEAQSNLRNTFSSGPCKTYHTTWESLLGRTLLSD